MSKECKEWKTGDKAGFIAYEGELEEYACVGVITHLDLDQGECWVENSEAIYIIDDISRLIDLSNLGIYVMRLGVKRNHFRVFATWPQNWRQKPIS